MSILKVGVVGAGWWATSNHIPLLRKMPNVQLEAVCRLGKDELEQVKSKFGFNFGFEDFDEMLNTCNLDAVFVVSPHHLHSVHAKKALLKGCHVFVEKPMAVSTAEAIELEKLAIEKDKVATIPYGWNFQDYAKVAKEWIDGGGLGEINHISMQMASPGEALFTGKVYPGTENEMFQPPASTWADPNNFGGYGWGQFPHILGFLFYIAESLEPESVFALSKASSTKVDMYDAATIKFKGGEIAALSGAGTVPMGNKFHVDIRIFGTDGMLLFDVERARLELKRHDGQDKTFTMDENAGDYECVKPVQQFVSLCLDSGGENSAPLATGRKSIEIIEAMYKSISSGKLEAV